ncbi:NUDIX hydrolase [Halomicrobium mukohataei DSM 12286]|uniref:NUDIX hydrolase n=2 Tax=Halomicrobium mukohataei TaxID=57705 RepID=C7P2M0_HALMD|nr:NUDIX hydrolase [Halomicrobium mukohataei DSM 12286]
MEWQAIVKNVPIVSVDLVVEHDGGVLLGKRKNEPAKGEWFVPGGTVLKNETRTDAVHRVADEEIGEQVVIDECLGTYEHFYDASEINGVDSKHYVVTAYRCHIESNNSDISSDDQHSAFEVFHPPFDKYHPYVERYLNDLDY